MKIVSKLLFLVRFDHQFLLHVLVQIHVVRVEHVQVLHFSLLDSVIVRLPETQNPCPVNGRHPCVYGVLDGPALEICILSL